MYVVVGEDGIVFFNVKDAVDFAFRCDNRLPAGPAYGLAVAAGGSVHCDGALGHLAEHSW
jgi:hypothetical protein